LGKVLKELQFSIHMIGRGGGGGGGRSGGEVGCDGGRSAVMVEDCLRWWGVVGCDAGKLVVMVMILQLLNQTENDNMFSHNKRFHEGSSKNVKI